MTGWRNWRRGKYMKMKLLVPIEQAISESINVNSTILDEDARRVLAVIVVKLLKKRSELTKAKKMIETYRELYPGIFPKAN